MRLEDFDYDLPASLIAQYPCRERDGCRLLTLERSTGAIEHRIFRELPEILRPGDLLIVNNSRVIPARVRAKKESGGTCEMLLIPPADGQNEQWYALVKRTRRIKEGIKLYIGEGLYGVVTNVRNGKAGILLSDSHRALDILSRVGRIPLPPYIRRQDEPSDREDYQTVFAQRQGSIAAPTAGLHFTEKLIEALKGRGVSVQSITLHVGIGTFAPVRVKDISQHRMDAEWVEITEETTRKIELTKNSGGRVVAVGTTTVRALESFSDEEGNIVPGKGYATLFIYPPYRFRVIDGLITNFHLPKSTLLMLVCAFAGRELVMKAYREAIENRYRFYSYGDAMLIL